MKIKNSLKKLFSILCSIVLLVTSLYVSIDYIKAKDSIIKTTTSSKYTRITDDATISFLHSCMYSKLRTNVFDDYLTSKYAITVLSTNNDTTTTYSDEVTILVDYNGGTCNGNTSMTLTKYPNESFGIISPIRKDCIFSGWEILSGDSIIEVKNGSYILTVGSQDTILRAIWKTETGENVVDTPAPTTEVTAPPTVTPSSTPAQKYINVTVSLEGGTYNGNSIVTQKVADKNTIVLFENVDLLQREGYKVAEFVSNYGGSCIILNDKRVVYTAPSYDSTKLDLITVVWEKIDDTQSTNNASPTPASKNTVYINLDGGTFNSNGNQEEIYYVDVNTVEVLFKTSDIQKDGYTLKGFQITDGVNYLIQGEDIILLSTDYKANSITMTAIWEQDMAPTSEPMIEPTIISTQVPTSEPTIEPTIGSTQLPTTPPTMEPADISTMEPTTVPTPTPVKITLKNNTIYMGVGENVTINATATQKAKITYKSQNNLICSVTSRGIIVGRKKGTTKVTISAGGTTKKISVHVLLEPTKIGLTTKMKRKVTYSMKKGKTKQLKVFFYQNSYSNTITFSSSNKKIATVTSTGKIKAIKKGTCKITVKSYNKKKAIATIKVT